MILHNSVMAESSWRSAEGLLAQMSNEGARSADITCFFNGALVNL